MRHKPREARKTLGGVSGPYARRAGLQGPARRTATHLLFPTALRLPPWSPGPGANDDLLHALPPLQRASTVPLRRGLSERPA